MFGELKTLDVVRYRHAISVLIRVFIEFTLDGYVDKHGIKLPLDNRGRPVAKLHTRFDHVTRHVKATKLMTEKELKPIDVALGDPDSLLAPDTLHAYVHSSWMNPDPMQLKLSWLNVQLFVERLWTSKAAGGQP